MEADRKENSSSKNSQAKRFFKTPSRVHSPLIKKERTSHQKKANEKVSFPPGIITKANEGDPIAQLELGKTFINTNFLQSNRNIAFDGIYRSADQGDMEAQFKLGDLYALGHGTSKSLSDAYKWYTRAAIQGYKKALLIIHNLYQEDIKMHCRGQMNSEEEEWVDDDFKRKNGIRELNEYRLQQNKSILNGATSYYTERFKFYQLSTQEDPDIQLNLAFLYQHGYGVKKCTRWAFEYYQMAAEQGNIDAQYNLGDLYRKHTNMKFNYRDSFKWLTKSAQGGNRAAQRSLAYFYLKGLATDMDYGVATLWYTKAAEAGDSEAMVTLGKLYRKGDYIKQDLLMAAHWYTLAARKGNIVAQNCLSQLHQRGLLGHMQLEEDMLEYLSESSMNSRLCTKLSLDICKRGDSPNFKQLNELAKRALIGDGQAMYEIGLKYLKGDNDFTQDEESGMKWIKHAANAKHRGAQFRIAEMYKTGDSVEQDYYKAAIWYKTLAKQKDAVAQYNVGTMYNEGLGVRKDPLEASKWFIWAADQGNSDARFCLSRLRYEGRAIRQDKKEGFALLNTSAHQGNARSCYDLGCKYITGSDVEANIKLGVALLKFAANSGFIPAQMELAFQYRGRDKFIEPWAPYGSMASDKSSHKCQTEDSVGIDIDLCIQYYMMASDAGSLEAKYQLGLTNMYFRFFKERDLHLQGDIGYFDYLKCKHRDYVKAYGFFKQAKEKGHVKAKHLFECHFESDYYYGMDYLAAEGMFTEVTEQRIDNLHYEIGYIREIKSRESHTISINTAIDWYMNASYKGDARADYQLGSIYYYGEYVEKNLDEAIRRYNIASKNGNTDAMYRLACIYLEGNGVDQDLLKAYHYYTKASIMGHQEAKEALVISNDRRRNEITVFRGFLTSSRKISEKTKIRMLEKATENGLTRLQYQLGLWYESKREYHNAFKWFSLSTCFGVTDAYYRVGILYEEGRGVMRNYIMAAKMYQRATEKEHENACFRLGQLYQYGKGIELDYLKAYQVYKMADDMGHVEAHKVLNITLEPKINSSDKIEKCALNPSSRKYQDSLSMCKYVAEHGNTEVQFKVGFSYEYCISEPNYVEAYKWYSLAAKEFYEKALYHLGLLHEKGLGTSQDYQKAIQLYEQASQLGNDNALYLLGHAYHHGNGVEISSSHAIEYYTISAKLGNPKYQCELGKLYEEGEFVQKNPLETLKWYTRAYLQGYDSIRSQLYAMYKDQPYEDFFCKKLFLNISKASRGQFRLTEGYDKDTHGDLNNRLGVFSALGRGTNKNAVRAWEYFTKNYDGLHREFRVEQILSFSYGLSLIDKDTILKSLVENESCMNQIHGEDLYWLGKYFFGGVFHTGHKYTTIGEYDNGDLSRNLLIEKDYSRAFKCLKIVADMGDSRACFLLGILYHCGGGVDQDQRQGDICFENAVYDNFEHIECIAMLYHTHKGMQNFKKAGKWYRRSIKAGDYTTIERVQAGLGLLYEYGDGVDKDYQKAFQCYKNISVGYNKIRSRSFGFHHMALMYYYGKGVSVDYEKSCYLFKEAVSSHCDNPKLPFVRDQNQLNGNDSRTDRVYCSIDPKTLRGESYYWLGILYKNGQGVSQDHKQAQACFVKALEYNCDRAKDEIDNLKPIIN